MRCLLATAFIFLLAIQGLIAATGPDTSNNTASQTSGQVKNGAPGADNSVKPLPPPPNTPQNRIAQEIINSTGEIRLSPEALQQLMNSQAVNVSTPQAAPTSFKDTASEVKFYINKLGSTIPIPEQSQAKQKLFSLGKKGVPYLAGHIQSDKRTYVRLQIAILLGRLKDPSVIPVLESTSQSPYGSLNRACAVALGNIGGKEALESLKRMKTITQDANVLEGIEESIKKIESENK